MAAQCLLGGAVDIARGGRRGARLRPASESQHRQAPHPFIVPSGLHAVRPDPKHAGKPPAPVDGNLHRHAGCSAAVLESIWSDLKYEGSPEHCSRPILLSVVNVNALMSYAHADLTAHPRS